MNSIFTGVAGMQATQKALDVIANNVANLNTVGYKAGRVSFSEALVQTLSNGSSAGTNPMQIGTGTSVASIDTNMTAGNMNPTGRTLDLAIDGSGYFVVQDGTSRYYTRDGAFQLDGKNRLVMASNGLSVLGWSKNIATGGWMTGSDPQIDTPSQLTIPLGTSYAVPTSKVSLSGNIDAQSNIGDNLPNTTFTFYDSLGTGHTMTMKYTKTADNEWQVDVSGDAETTLTSGTSFLVTFNGNGQADHVTTVADPTTSLGTSIPVSFTLTNGASAQNVRLDLSTVSQLAKVNADDTSMVQAITQDGLPMGTLENFSIDDSGMITGSYSNGASRVLGQLAVGRFTNPAGLSKQGGNLWISSPNSGDPVIQPPTMGGGKIRSGYLEGSNVDLSNELANMIIMQRGFQANSKSITTSDELMQDILQLKR